MESAIPSSRKKAKKANAPAPIEHATRARAHWVECFKLVEKDNASHDMEQNIREIQAILAVNSEIFNRCISSMKSEYSTKGDEDCNNQYFTVFSRRGFNVVETRKVKSKTQFVTYSENSEIIFNTTILSTASNIGALFALQYKHGALSKFIDFESLFERTLTLHNDVLENLLIRFKDHLESVQVCLGKIDAWVMEPYNNISFLEKTFGKELSAKDALLGNYDSSDSYDSSYESDSSSDSTKRKNGTILKEFEVPGRHEATFTISNSSDQRKLKKFLDFISS